MHIRRFTRKTNAITKKFFNLKAAVALFVVWYNFCRVHQTLRVTPAMEAGITRSRLEHCRATWSSIESQIMPQQISPLWAILASLFSSILTGSIAYFIGYRNGKIAKSSLSLQIKKATPIIGSNVHFRKFHPSHMHPHVTRYAIDTTVYNYGELVALKIDGQWNLSSAQLDQKIQQPIRADALASSGPYKFEYQLPWVQVVNRLTVDIDFLFFGIEGKQEQYHASYEYDPQKGGDFVKMN